MQIILNGIFPDETVKAMYRSYNIFLQQLFRHSALYDNVIGISETKMSDSETGLEVPDAIWGCVLTFLVCVKQCLCI